MGFRLENLGLKLKGLRFIGFRGFKVYGLSCKVSGFRFRRIQD